MLSTITDTVSPDDVAQIEEGLIAFNEAKSDVGAWHQKVFVARDEKNRVVGGVILNVHWHWLHIDILFVEEEFRHQGLGSQLLISAETYAKSLDCVGSYLDTLSFQAPDFYTKHGYKTLAKLDNFPPGRHQKVYLYKRF